MEGHLRTTSTTFDGYLVCSTRVLKKVHICMMYESSVVWSSRRV